MGREAACDGAKQGGQAFCFYSSFLWAATVRRAAERVSWVPCFSLRQLPGTGIDCSDNVSGTDGTVGCVVRDAASVIHPVLDAHVGFPRARTQQGRRRDEEGAGGAPPVLSGRTPGSVRVGGHRQYCSFFRLLPRRPHELPTRPAARCGWCRSAGPALRLCTPAWSVARNPRVAVPRKR